MFYVSDIPPEMPVTEARVMCSIEAAARYKLPADLIFAISLTEGGKAGTVSKNKNGTFDLGFMQFNTSYLNTLKGYGIKESDVLASTCYPFHLAAWRINAHLEESGPEDLLTKVAYYHSRTEKYNEIYQQRLVENAQKFFDHIELIEKYEKRCKEKLLLAQGKIATKSNEKTVTNYELLEPKADDATIAQYLSNSSALVIIPEAK